MYVNRIEIVHGRACIKIGHRFYPVERKLVSSDRVHASSNGVSSGSNIRLAGSVRSTPSARWSCLTRSDHVGKRPRRPY